MCHGIIYAWCVCLMAHIWKVLAKAQPTKTDIAAPKTDTVVEKTDTSSEKTCYSSKKKQ